MMNAPVYTPVIFEHPKLGTLVVAGMMDVDNETTDDIQMAMWVTCVVPDGSRYVLLPPNALAEGTLIQVGRLH